VAIDLPRVEAGRAEGRLVGGVGKFLRLERDTIAHPVKMTALAANATVKRIGAI